MARVGKIARLPHDTREALNARLLAGEPASRILPWLNADPAVLAVLAEQFNGNPVNDENLSQWRMGGFQDWQGRREKVATVRELSQFAAHLAQANGASIAEGGVAIVSGRILELLEACQGTVEPKDLGDLISGLTNLRGAEIAQQRVELEREKLKRKDQDIALERQKFEQRLKEYQDRVAAQKAAIQGVVEKARDGGLTSEGLRTIEQAAALL